MRTEDPETNAETVRRLTAEAWTGTDLDFVDEFVSEDYVEHAPRGEVRGREGYEEGIGTFTTAFPDLVVAVGDLLARDDRVAVRFTGRGTQEGTFTGIDPTGNEVTVSGPNGHRFADGEVVEEWSGMDVLGATERLVAGASGDVPGGARGRGSPMDDRGSGGGRRSVDP